jgi:hypothetical protein
MMKFALLALLFFSSSSHALEKGTIRAAGLVGQVGLFGDPGTNGSNALGLAGEVGFQVNEPLAIDIRYLGSSQTEIDHRDLSVGAEYAFADFESGYPHAELGMSFIHNDWKNAAIGGDAAGIYVGGGLDFELTKSLQIGPDARFVKAFASHGLVKGADQTTVGDNYSVMIRLSYLFSRDQ